MTFEFTPTDDGFRIHDTIENAWTDLHVGGATEPDPADVDVFRVPLDTAVRFETDAIHLDANIAYFVRDQSARLVETCEVGGEATIDPGRYEIETSFQLFKLYIRVEDTAVRIQDRPSGSSIEFGSTVPVTIGVRSTHRHPAGVLTTSQDPRDLMRAVSTFGTAMKTFSPERSFPTLRGHPPELAVRGQTSIPEQFTPPDTGITVSVPPEYASVFTVAPLAYYLGATVEPGFEPRLVAGETFHALDESNLPESVLELLRHCFLLDTVVRTVGLYPTELEVGRRLDERVSIDRDTLYDLPIAERTSRYLDVPLDATRDLLTWPAVADVEPVPLNAEALPYLLYRMAAIRSPTEGRSNRVDCCTSATDDDSADTGGSSPLRSFTPGEPDSGNSISFVDPAPFDAAQHIWIGDGLPITGCKPTLGAYLRSTDATPKDDRISINVVTTGEPDEGSGRSIADQYTAAGFDVSLYEDPTTSELKDILMTDQDLLHFRGPVTDAGLECLDGPLDLRILPRTGVSAFFLDGECSYRQGLPLARVGSIAGVVTTTDERPESGEAGLTLASLLDHGFPLAAAVDVLDDLVGRPRYMIVGDCSHQLRKSTNYAIVGEPVPDAGDDTFTLRFRFYPTLSHGLGTYTWHMEQVEDVSHLTGTHEQTFDASAFDAIASHMEHPLLVDGELHWPDDYTPEELWDLLQ